MRAVPHIACRLRTVFASLLLFSMALPVAATDAHVPMLWRIDGSAGDVYLLGSVHLLKETDYPLAEEIEAAYADAEELVFELSPADMRSGAAGARMMRMGALPAGESLREHVSAETWAAVQAYVDGGGYLPLSAIERMRPWMLALTLSVMQMQRAGLDPAFGIEQHFLRKLDADGKLGAGMETIDQQLALFAEASAREQDEQLHKTLQELPGMEAQLDEMRRLWRSGDVDGLHALISEEMDEYPAVYDRLIVDRNRAWIPQVEAQLADEGDELVIVGAAHLVGPDGVVALLRARGHAVERIAAPD